MQKGNKSGRKFSKDNQPTKNGRKPSRIKQLIASFKVDAEHESMSREDAFKIYGYLLSCTKTQIETILRSPDLPFAIVLQIRAMFEDAKNGRADTVDKIFDRIYGKANQPMEITGAGGTPLIPNKPMTRKGFEKLLEDMKCGKV